MTTEPDDDQDKPLDAAQLKLQARLTRLLVYSGGIMALGLIAVFAAILYRVNRAETRPTLDPSRPPLVETMTLPAGGRVVSSRLDGTTLVVTVEHPKGATILLVDAPSLKAMRRLDLTAP
jgi:hypothetical protein